ncbi:MAG: hypothetical protein NTW32_12370 [Chloroflexi bacterium]|nr:hypothetical protein [Chloroflexota bacterium]
MTITTPIQKKKGLTIYTKQSLWGLSFVLPAFIFFAIFAFYPMINAFFISFTDYNLMNDPKFVGLENYDRMLSDARFKITINNTMGFVIGSTIPTILLSLGLALVLQRNFIGRDFVRTLYFLPIVFSGVEVSIGRILHVGSPVAAWLLGR